MNEQYLDTELRAIIGHALLGEDQNISRKGFDLVITEIIKLIIKSKGSSGKETGMKWVKASERLPEKRHNYFVKFRTPKNSVINSYLWNGTCVFDGEKFIDDINKAELSSGNTVEQWLDESVPPYKEEAGMKGITTNEQT